jgi:hypothetical protein
MSIIATPSITITPVTGEYVTPNILVNASFETGYEGFLTGSATSPPSGVGRTQDQAYMGTWSLYRSWTSGGDVDSQCFYNIGSQSHFWTRFWYYFTVLPNGAGFKVVRYQDSGFNHANGMQILSGKWIWVGNTAENIAYTDTSPITGAWHSVEFEWNKTTKQIHMWQDGTAMLQGSSTDSGLSWSGATLTYTTEINPVQLDIIRVINARTNSGTAYFDRIAVSNAGRIGP